MVKTEMGASKEVHVTFADVTERLIISLSAHIVMYSACCF